MEEVNMLRKLNFSWERVRKIIGVGKTTMHQWKKSVNYVEPLQGMTDEEIDTFVNHNKQKDRGEVYLQGLVLAAGHHITRERLRASVGRVDAAGRELRKQKAIKRREYNAAGPHHIWHIDGHHKLIKYGLVTHGCIDGFSRTVIYLQCNDNNKSTTTLKLFQNAVTKHTLPGRVRGDRGGENVLIADAMIAGRGADRRSFIGGSSKHNTRIERLWRDVRRKVIGFYMDLFANMVVEGLDVGDSNQLFILQYMFKTRINEELVSFTNGWNNHKLSTEKYKTPLQLIEENIIDIPDEVIYDEFDDPEEDEITEGVQHVQVNPLLCPFTAAQLEYFKSQCNPLTRLDAPETLYDKYLCALEFSYLVLSMNI